MASSDGGPHNFISLGARKVIIRPCFRHMVNVHLANVEGNSLLLRRDLLLPTSRNRSFIHGIQQTDYFTPHPLLNQLWSTGWDKRQRHGSAKGGRTNHLPLSYGPLPYSTRILRKCVELGCRSNTISHIFILPYNIRRKIFTNLTTTSSTNVNSQKYIYCLKYDLLLACLWK